MGNIKANRKFVNEKESVSAVIGVVLMVAITVAIAATVYVYISGMSSTSSPKTIDIAFYPNYVTYKLIVTTVSDDNVLHSDVKINPSSGTADWAAPSVGYNFLAVGDQIAVTDFDDSGWCNFTIVYKNTFFVGSYNFKQ